MHEKLHVTFSIFSIRWGSLHVGKGADSEGRLRRKERADESSG